MLFMRAASITWASGRGLGSGNLDIYVHETTHGPLIDTALYVMVFMRANPLLGKWEGLSPRFSTFLGPKWHSPNRLNAIS